MSRAGLDLNEYITHFVNGTLWSLSSERLVVKQTSVFLAQTWPKMPQKNHATQLRARNTGIWCGYSTMPAKKANWQMLLCEWKEKHSPLTDVFWQPVANFFKVYLYDIN